MWLSNYIGSLCAFCNIFLKKGIIISKGMGGSDMTGLISVSLGVVVSALILMVIGGCIIIKLIEK